MNNEIIKNATVVGATRKEYRNGKIPVAFISISEGCGEREGIILELIKKYMLSKPSPRDVPMEYHILDTIPITSNGKVDYKKLEQLAEKI